MTALAIGIAFAGFCLAVGIENGLKAIATALYKRKEVT